MSYTFSPEKAFAKACSKNSRISQKNAMVVCSAIKNKPLKRALRLLDDLDEKKRSLGGKYYSNAAEEIKYLVHSCEKNAEFMNLDKERLFVHASAHKGSSFFRRRRKGAFGSRLKTTNLEVMLIESGKERKHAKASEKKVHDKMKSITEKKDNKDAWKPEEKKVQEKIEIDKEAAVKERVEQK